MDIRKAIDKLNNIDAKDLRNVDLSKLKEYNFSRLQDDLMTKPKVLFNAVFVLIAFVSFLYAVSHYRSAASDIRTRESEAQLKLTALTENKTTEASFNKFLENFPKIIPDNQLIGKISEFAEMAHINIVSFSPVKLNETDYVTQYVVNLNVEVQTYQDLVDFIYLIENSEYTLRVNKWTVQSKGLTYARKAEQKDVPLEVFIEIGSFQLKDV